MKVKSWLILVALAVGLTGCASKDPYVIATTSLVSMKDVTVGLAKAGDAACTQGVLKQKQCDSIATAYGQAQISWEVAADLLEASVETKDKNMLVKFSEANRVFLANYQNFYQLAIEMGLFEMGGKK
jgi:type IV pilus biogenesis protein CpaD/CtpE